MNLDFVIGTTVPGNDNQPATIGARAGNGNYAAGVEWDAVEQLYRVSYTSKKLARRIVVGTMYASIRMFVEAVTYANKNP